MSVVVAIKSGDKVFIGADSQVTKGGTRTTLKNPNNYKVWKVNPVDHCLMAHVGNVRDANIIKTMDNLVSEYNVFRGHVDYEFVVRKIVPSIIEELKEFNYLKVSDSYFDSMDSAFFFAFENQLFSIGVDGCVIEIDDYAALGSGSDQAIGSLLSTEDEDPRERIIKAIKASAASDIYVDYPIIITNTENTEFEIITETDASQYLIHKNGKK